LILLDDRGVMPVTGVVDAVRTALDADQIAALSEYQRLVNFTPNGVEPFGRFLFLIESDKGCFLLDFLRRVFPLRSRPSADGVRIRYRSMDFLFNNNSTWA